MKSSIKYKLLPIIIIGIIALSAVFYLFALQTQKANLDKVTLDGIQAAKETFYNLEKNDVKMLQAAMTDFSTNQEYKDVFLENDRQKLFDFGQALFAEHKAMGITHFYFHRPDGTVFVRLHDATKYDDVLKRKTFAKSKETKSWGTGIELGKTAFALRAVEPYYNGKELIGYIEFGEEINHFIDIMKEQTGHEYSVVVKKEFIDPGEWASVTKTKGLRNNYGDLKNYVVIDSTREYAAKFNKDSFAQQNLDAVADKGNIFSKFTRGDKTYVSGGFALYDAGNDKVGAVIVTEDVTQLEKTATQNNQNVLITAILAALLIAGIMSLLLVLLIIRPLENVVETTTRVVGGDFSARSNVKSKDEIGRLAQMIEGFKTVLINTAKDLEESQKEEAREKVEVHD